MATSAHLLFIRSLLAPLPLQSMLVYAMSSLSHYILLLHPSTFLHILFALFRLLLFAFTLT